MTWTTGQRFCLVRACGALSETIVADCFESPSELRIALCRKGEFRKVRWLHLPPDYTVEREIDGCWGLRAFIWNFCCPLVKGRL